MRLGSCPCEDLYEASFAVTFLSVLSRCCFQRLRQPWPWARCCWTLHQGRITLDLQQRLLASAFADPACSCIGWSRHGSRRKILFDTMAHLRELYRKLAVCPSRCSSPACLQHPVCVHGRVGGASFRSGGRVPSSGTLPLVRMQLLEAERSWHRILKQAIVE